MASPRGDQEVGLGPESAKDILRTEHFKDVKDPSFKTAQLCVLGQPLTFSVSLPVEQCYIYSACHIYSC